VVEGADELFGWKIGVSKRIFGGSSGYSVGKVNRARKKPPVRAMISPDFKLWLLRESWYLRRTLCRRQS
jgi:hypothetical protein